MYSMLLNPPFVKSCPQGLINTSSKVKITVFVKISKWPLKSEFAFFRQVSTSSYFIFGELFGFGWTRLGLARRVQKKVSNWFEICLIRQVSGQPFWSQSACFRSTHKGRALPVEPLSSEPPIDVFLLRFNSVIITNKLNSIIWYKAQN